MRRANKVNPHNPTTIFAIANCFAATDVYDSAEVYYEQCIKDNGDGDQVNYFLGTVQEKLGKIDEAADSFRRALTFNPDHRDCLQALGVVYLEKGDFALATEQFDRAVTVDDSFWAGWIGLGAAHSLNGMSEQSNLVLEKLFAKDSVMGYQMMDIVRQYHPRTRGER